MSNIILILGGARSGKSSFAEEIAKKIGGKDVYYIATAKALDEEMEERIKHHKKSRPKEWKTLEESKYISKVLKDIPDKKTILIDCLTLMVSNILLDNEKNKEEVENKVLKEIKKVIKIAKDKKIDLILVSNEVGLGLVPSYELGRSFRDVAGRTNQYVAKKADQVLFTVSGIPIDIKKLSIDNIDEIISKQESN